MDINIIILILFYFLLPLLLLFLERKVAIIQKISPIVILYIVGILLGNIGLIGEKYYSIQDTLSSIAVLFAIPLMLFSLDIKKWKKLAKPSLISFGIIIVADFLAVLAGFFIFKDKIPEVEKVGGMLVGVYTGGTPNLAALKIALKVSPSIYVATHTSDIIVSSVYLIFIITVGKKIFGLILPEFTSSSPELTQEKLTEEKKREYEGILSKNHVTDFIKFMILDIIIVAISLGLSMVFKNIDQTLLVILCVTTFGLLASFIKPIRNLKNTFQVGQYFVMVFCLIVGSMANIQKLLTNASSILFYTSIAVFGSLLFHLIGARIFKIDTDTMIITSVSAIFSPPFVPMVATAIKNKEVIFSGIITGLIGYAIGNYFGIVVNYILNIL
ncbi:MAG: DUF819 family protein [Spirochaetes bacterium]|nr:DUF819 family protein [Spirochaetota bacterium]MBP8991062.1 DUF819 family protein [Spirochaetota bacterium]HOV46927.1 DUF819 family protein [Exilispira sp.]HPB48136.1 DUF819 family protein [Exilispira sp.]